MRKQLLFAFVVLLVVNDAMATRNMRRSNDLQKTSTKNNVKEPQNDGMVMGAPMVDTPPTAEADPACPVGFDFAGQIDGLCRKIHTLREDVENNKVELVSLTEGRCTANMLFIEALKEHKIAIDICRQMIDMSQNFDT